MNKYEVGKIYKGFVNEVDILILGVSIPADSVRYFEFKNWKIGTAPLKRMLNSLFFPSDSKYFFAVTSTYDNGDVQWHHQSHSYNEAARIYNGLVKHIGKNEVLELRVAESDSELEDNYSNIITHEYGKMIKWA